MRAEPVLSLLSNIGPMELVVLALLGAPIVFIAWTVLRPSRSDNDEPRS